MIHQPPQYEAGGNNPAEHFFDAGSSRGLPEGRSDCGRTLQQSQLPGTAFAASPNGQPDSDGIVLASRGKTMFEFQDLFQWDRFITPTIIKTFYWLIIALICLMGLSGIFSGLALMAISPFSGFLVVLSSIAGVVVGIVFSRIVSEFILIVFRINEHLGAIRSRGESI
jgi:hypothetical protein